MFSSGMRLIILKIAVVGAKFPTPSASKKLVANDSARSLAASLGRGERSSRYQHHTYQTYTPISAPSTTSRALIAVCSRLRRRQVGQDSCHTHGRDRFELRSVHPQR